MTGSPTAIEPVDRDPHDELLADEGGPGRGVPGAAALRKGIAVLDLIADAARPMRFGELVDMSGLPKGTLHRIVSGLIDARLVRYEQRDQTYRLGMRLFEMAHKVWDDFDLRGAAEPELERLAAATGEATRLGILDGVEIVYIDQREAHQTVRLGNGVGSRVRPHASAGGKAIMAHMNPADLVGLLSRLKLERFTPNTITNADELRRQLDLTKARGYAISVEESNDGVAAVAAAVLDSRNRPLGAISINGPAFRLPVERLHSLGRDVMEAARRTSGNAGQVLMSITTNPRPLGTEHADLTLFAPGSAFLGEGPHWSAGENRLYWVDILTPAIHWVDRDKPSDVKTMAMPELISAVVTRQRGGLIAATQNGFKAIDLTSGAISPLADPESDRPGNRFNDGKCDRAGRFWAGTLSIDTSPGEGNLYCLDTDGRVRQVDSGFHISNGLGWSPDDRRMYFADSGRRIIFVYDFDLASGEVANRRPFIKVPDGEGTPDGLTVDSQGFVWVAHWDGWCVTRYDPDGQVERVINLPVPRPTSCVFGGPDLDTLYITTARIRLSAERLAEAPSSGSVFAFRTGVIGLPEASYAG